MSPPSMYERTSPNNRNTSRITKLVHSILGSTVRNNSATADILIHSGAKELPRFGTNADYGRLGKAVMPTTRDIIDGVCDHEIPTDPTAQIETIPSRPPAQEISRRVTLPFIFL